MKTARVVLLMMLVLASTICYSQSAAAGTKKTLLADETWLAASGDKHFRIITCNDSIAHKVMSSFEKDMTRFTYNRKKDRHGDYWERSFYFLNEHYAKIIGYIKKLNVP